MTLFGNGAASESNGIGRLPPGWEPAPSAVNGKVASLAAGTPAGILAIPSPDPGDHPMTATKRYGSTLTVAQFCQAVQIHTGEFYRLLSVGKGPRIMRIGQTLK